MRRSPLLTIQVFCPHFERPVKVQRNEITERLVDCSDKDQCASREVSPAGVTVTIFPKVCPVFRS